MIHQQHTWHLCPGVCWKVWSLLTWAATNLVLYDCLFSSHGESREKYNLTEPIPFQVEHVTFVFIMEPFCPSGPFLRTMKLSAQWRRADTSYFTHNWDNVRLVEGGSILFLPIQVQRRCPLPPQNVTSVKKLCWRRLHSKYQNLLGYHRPRYQTHRICLQSSTIPGCRTQSKHTISMRNPTHTINSARCRLHSQ